MNNVFTVSEISFVFYQNSECSVRILKMLIFKEYEYFSFNRGKLSYFFFLTKNEMRENVLKKNCHVFPAKKKQRKE